MLQLALADVNHHLALAKSRSQLTLVDIQNLQQFLDQVVQLSKEAKDRYSELQ